jgi:hypothetical protein
VFKLHFAAAETDAAAAAEASEQSHACSGPTGMHAMVVPPFLPLRHAAQMRQQTPLSIAAAASAGVNVYAAAWT